MVNNLSAEEPGSFGLQPERETSYSITSLKNYYASTIFSTISHTLCEIAKFLIVVLFSFSFHNCLKPTCRVSDWLAEHHLNICIHIIITYKDWIYIKVVFLGEPSFHNRSNIVGVTVMF